MLIHALACVGMPAEITIYLSADHIRAEESNRGIKEVVQKNYASSDYSSLLTSYFIASPFFSTDPHSLGAIEKDQVICCVTKGCRRPVSV